MQTEGLMPPNFRMTTSWVCLCAIKISGLGLSEDGSHAARGRRRREDQAEQLIELKYRSV